MTGSPLVDTVSLSRKGNSRIGVDNKAGKVVMTYSGVLSADGQTFTVQQKGIDATGQAVSASLVFVRQS